MRLESRKLTCRRHIHQLQLVLHGKHGTSRHREGRRSIGTLLALALGFRRIAADLDAGFGLLPAVDEFLLIIAQIKEIAASNEVDWVSTVRTSPSDGPKRLAMRKLVIALRSVILKSRRQAGLRQDNEAPWLTRSRLRSYIARCGAIDAATAGLAPSATSIAKIDSHMACNSLRPVAHCLYATPVSTYNEIIGQGKDGGNRSAKTPRAGNPEDDAGCEGVGGTFVATLDASDPHEPGRRAGRCRQP